MADTGKPEPVALIAQTCPLCGMEEQHPIPLDGYMKFKSGMLVQRALPSLNECIREFLITGMCTDCREETDKATAAMEDDDRPGPDYEIQGKEW